MSAEDSDAFKWITRDDLDREIDTLKELIVIQLSLRDAALQDIKDVTNDTKLRQDKYNIDHNDIIRKTEFTQRDFVRREEYELKRDLVFKEIEFLKASILRSGGMDEQSERNKTQNRWLFGILIAIIFDVLVRLFLGRG